MHLFVASVCISCFVANLALVGYIARADLCVILGFSVVGCVYLCCIIQCCPAQQLVNELYS